MEKERRDPAAEELGGAGEATTVAASGAASGVTMGAATGAALAAALCSGLLTGAVARLLMRAIAVTIGTESAFSLAGTAGIFIVFAVLALPAAATATARPAVRRAGRWVTAAVTGWAAARTGFADAQALLLADDGRLPLLAALATAFGVLVVAHGWLAQRLARRLAQRLTRN
ncbi:hypothetical protein [Microtetraspora sp. NBRC 16547]|uniref:hypothetical protein n=1 Tax=Microtetraspora sp. NBRC 16547 TaxID=3030993 RepID=UPI0024A5DC63|nr:hypothetical protein [Microtetraspora sp. NBRC 16547]GLX00230.1 hypothetical protein Misp02_43160 [Microtetraspora sp. NBRC 16547]